MSKWIRRHGSNPEVAEEGGSGMPSDDPRIAAKVESGRYKAIEWKFGAPNTEVGNRYMALMEEFEQFNNQAGEPRDFVELVYGVPADFVVQVIRNIAQSDDPASISIAIQLGIWIGQRAGKHNVPADSVKA